MTGHDVSSEPDGQEVALAAPLRSERLLLRPAVPADADATWPIRRQPAVHEWLTATPTDLDAYRTVFCEPDRLTRTIAVELLAEPGTVIGDLMLKREDGWAQTDVADQASGVQAELGWVIDPAYGGRGYATEAVHELVRHCFEDLGLRRVSAGCFAANEPSWRLMERIGMRREAYNVRESLHRSLGWLDGVAYALLADEWRDGPAHPSRSRPG